MKGKLFAGVGHDEVSAILSRLMELQIRFCIGYYASSIVIGITDEDLDILPMDRDLNERYLPVSFKAGYSIYELGDLEKCLVK
jgi:hypothetical protein